MRPAIRSALEYAAELTRRNRLAEAVAVAQAAFHQATDDEFPEIRQWLTDHAHDFTGKDTPR